MPLKAIVKEDDCPEKVVFYHGCPFLGVLPSIRREGIIKGRTGGYYSASPATYWSTSSVFAIWWCAILQVKEEAIKAGVWYALREKQEHRPYMQDAVPDSLQEVKCLVIASTWTKKEIYKMYINDNAMVTIQLSPAFSLIR
jgi:hypothetical protein